MLHRIKQAIPESFKRPYHYLLAKLAAVMFGFPSRKLVVIGVTGTNGKSSTVQFIAQMLTTLGYKVGYTTTAGFWIAGESIENKMKMTMPGRFYLQSLLRRMVRGGSQFAIIETSSQGIVQYRHLGVNYDVAVFTNLTPEHIEAHGGFENYKQAKGQLFAHTAKCARKRGIVYGGEKIGVVNADDEHAKFFASFPLERVVRFSWRGKGDVNAKAKKVRADGVDIAVNGEAMEIPLGAEFQQKNALCAMAVLLALHIPAKDVARAVADLDAVPGRFERVDLGQPFEVIVDYAYEPYALEALFASARRLEPKRVIGIHGSAGGGRDVARREKIGELAGREENVVIVTNEDPYDEDPRAIIDAVADGARRAGKQEGKDLFLIDDREEAIRTAINMAKKGDIVLITGKGSEPVMAVAGGKKIAWSDRAAAERALKARFL